MTPGTSMRGTALKQAFVGFVADEAAVKKRGFMVFARFDHAAGAESVGLKMPRSTVIVFGNPRAGTPAFIKSLLLRGC